VRRLHLHCSRSDCGCAMWGTSAKQHRPTC
jgi:hypothetical protein